MKREEHRISPSPIPEWSTLFTSMFLHAGIMHIAGNLWFLYIFGDNVEDRFGHRNYLLMYLASGLAAGLLHVFSGPDSGIPTIGASGAISGVMGAYLLLYPTARVVALIPLGPVITQQVLPAPLFLGIWFVIQLVSGLGSSGNTGGVAWWAHVGGFGAGFALAWAGRSLGLFSAPKARYDWRKGSRASDQQQW